VLPGEWWLEPADLRQEADGPGGLVERVDPEERKLYLSVTKDEVKAAPDDDPGRFRDAGYRAEVGDHYNRVTR
jgi:hypothetical protein